MSIKSASLAEVVDAMRSQRVVPVLRSDEGSQTIRDVDRLLSHRVDLIELTTTIPGWLDVLRAVVAAHPSATFGVGTVTNSADAERACEAGAGFLVSPYPADDVRRVAAREGVPFIGGGFTPAEIAASASHGAAKLFPAHLGGPAYLRTLSAILPGVLIMPTGGVRLSEVREWLDAGAFAVGVGSGLAAAEDLEQELAQLWGDTA